MLPTAARAFAEPISCLRDAAAPLVAGGKPRGYSELETVLRRPAPFSRVAVGSRDRGGTLHRRDRHTAGRVAGSGQVPGTDPDRPGVICARFPGPLEHHPHAGT